jgi:gluconokinase
MLLSMAATEHPAAIVVMGVSGSGKTEIGRLLAERLGWCFRDADEFHPPENVAKMRAGIPLDDADREPWLATLAAVLEEAITAGTPLVLACSALKRGHRTRLGLPRGHVRLVHLDGSPDVIKKRIEQRAGHFMPATLLDSQLAALERPGPDENAIVVDVSPEPDAIVRRLTAALGLP